MHVHDDSEASILATFTLNFQAYATYWENTCTNDGHESRKSKHSS